MRMVAEAQHVRAGDRVLLGKPYDPPNPIVRSVERTAAGLIEIHFDRMHLTVKPARMVEIEAHEPARTPMGSAPLDNPNGFRIDRIDERSTVC